MKRFFLMTVVISNLSLQAQTENFDIASFVAPKGWQRIDTNGVLAFIDSKTSNGLTSFCQIYLFPSYQSSNTPEKNFETEWSNKVVKTAGISAKPVMQPAVSD